MKVLLDELRCDAHGVCVAACPEVFALDDDDDVVRVLVDEPDESLRPAVTRAASACPKAAITIEDQADDAS
jgi:ferredoxin